jgi:hypothetical protein
MSTFRIGQRVRINCPRSPRHGLETVVTRLGVKGRDFGGAGFIGIEVALKCSTPGWPLCVYERHELVPIIDDGRKVVEWSECLWKPEGVSA